MPQGPDSRPSLFLVTVDTEEDGLWTGDYPRHPPCTNLDSLPVLSRLLDAYDLKGTYLTTYPVAADERAATAVAAATADGRGEVGTHLHPWCSPPFEDLEARHPRFPHCLPPPLQQAKLQELAAMLTRRFGEAPVSYRAGRWGFSATSVAPLLASGHQVDSSVVPGWWMKEPGAPSFTGAPQEPYFLDPEQVLRPGRSRLLEVPVTTGYSGPALGRLLARRVPAWLPGGRTLAARAGFSILRPALHDERTLATLTRRVMATRPLVVNVMLHSTELAPGHSPYARDAAARDSLLQRLRTIIETALQTAPLQGACLRDVRAIMPPPVIPDAA